MSDKEKYELSKTMLIAYFIVWGITTIIIHIYSIHSSSLAFVMTLIYLLVQNFNQTYRYKIESVARYQDVINIADIFFISTTMWIILAGLLVVVPLYFIFFLLIIICTCYIWIIKYCKKKSEEEQSKRIKK